MANAVDNKKVKMAALAKQSVMTWFNSDRLIEVVKPIAELKRDAHTVKKLNLSKISDIQVRRKKWLDMESVFEYRFGVKL